MKAATTPRQRAPHSPDPHLTGAAVDLLAAHAEYWAHQKRVRGRVIAAARRAGLTWAQVADALGEKQDAVRVAHQRYVASGQS